MNKLSLVNLANKLNVPTPLTIYCRNNIPDSTEIEKLIFPCLIRPELSTSWWYEPLKSVVNGQKLLIINSRESFLKKTQELSAFNSPYFIQEIIPGEDTNLYYLVLYMNSEGKCMGYFAGGKKKRDGAYRQRLCCE